MTLSRRAFLKVSATAGGGMLIAVSLPGCTGGGGRPRRSPSGEGSFASSVYVRIDPAGTVTVTAFRSEMGQGVRTAIAMLVAEELDADWSDVRVEQAPASTDYGDQLTGGSLSVSSHYWVLRQAGADARSMLVRAAAERWGVDPTSCRTEAGWVIGPNDDQRVPYGDLVAAAARLAPPGDGEIELKDPGAFRIIGTPTVLHDAPDIVAGTAVFTSDVSVPGMAYAVIARPPVIDGAVGSFDPSAARRVPGVRDVLEVSAGVAVIADDTWAAIRGRDALKVTWTGGSTDVDSDQIRREMVSPTGSSGGGELRAGYDLPFYAHAAMEPMCCVADVRSDGCEIWAPTQDPQGAMSAAGRVTSLSADRISVHIPLIGGRFGQGLQSDYVEDAVELSQALGIPVKLVWTRPDDLRDDFYHPLTHMEVSGSSKRPEDVELDARAEELVVRTGPWRAVDNVAEAFAHESFVDELAAREGADPVRFRLDSYPAAAQPCIRLAARESEWGGPMPTGWGRGIAYHATWGVTHVAQVAEVSVGQDASIRVHRVVCAVDAGTVINPDSVRAQMEGGIAFGLTAALKDEVTIRRGRVLQGNFDDYRLLRFDEMPQVDVHIVPSDQAPQGIGEMGVPPIAPAVANAVFAATGKRLRSLPLRL
jgi:isoquinoline 1-oxidoreductase beta subunit